MNKCINCKDECEKCKMYEIIKKINEFESKAFELIKNSVLAEYKRSKK